MKTNLSFWVIFCFIVLSCAPPNQNATSDEIVEIKWYVKSQPAENAWEQSIIPDFESKYPNIKVNLIIATSREYDTKMMAMYASDTPPDVFSHWGQTGWGDFYRRGLIADLTPYIVRDKYDLSDFIPEVLNGFTINDKIFGIPIFRTGSFVFYNKDIFDRAGVSYPPTSWDDKSWNWDEFISKCQQLTNNTSNIQEAIYGCYFGLWPLDAYPLLFGENIFPDEIYKTGFTYEANLNTPNSIKVFDDWQRLIWDDRFIPDPAVADVIGSAGIFQSGKIAMELGGGWGWWNYKGLESKFQWGVAALPFGNENRKGISFADPWLMSSKSQHPDEAWEFIKYLSSPEIQRSWMEAGGVPPARLSLINDWYNQFPSMSPSEVRDVHLGAIKYGQICPCDFMVRYDQVDQFLFSSIDPILNNQENAKDIFPRLNIELEGLLMKISNEYKTK